MGRDNMIWSGYNQMVQDWIANVEYYRGKDADQILDYAEKIKQLGESTKDAALLGFSYYYIAETHYMLNDVEKFLEHIMQSLEHLQRSKQWRLMAQAYNLLGIASNNQGNAPFALDYYLVGTSVCEINGLPLEKAIIEYNIGSIYMTYQEYSRAIHYLESSAAGFGAIPENEQIISYRYIIYMSLASCHMALHNMERAGYYLSRVKEESAGALEDMEKMYFLCVQARYYNELPNAQLRDECIQEIWENLTPHLNIIDIFDDIYNYCQMLLDIDKFQELWAVLDMVDSIIRPANLVYLQRRMLNIKLEYYKKTGDNSGFLQAAGLYYELSRMKEREEAYVTGSMLNVRFSLEEAKKRQRQVEAENQKLQQQSETDSLTGIANRMCLNRKAEEIFVQAFNEGSYIGVEILDVDYFKEYNDNYGHQQGDECLKAVASQLKKLTEHGNIFVARYGGDEFTIIYKGYSPEAVQRFAQELKEGITNLAMEHRFSKALPIVTISQGICCDIPKKGNKVWDFLHSADAMLYRVKRNCRNAIAMGSCVRDETGTDTESGEMRII